jgi:hypothetical protein
MGASHNLWVDYDGTSKLLEVFLADSDVKPASPLFSFTIDIPAVVGSSAFFGFSAATGGLQNIHDVEDWQLEVTNSPAPVELCPVTPPVPNDDISSATVVAPLPFVDLLDTTDATTDPGDPICAGNGHTVWYRFTASQDMRIVADTLFGSGFFGSAYNTTLSVYTGEPGALTQIACNDDSAGSLQSQVEFDATAGQTFFLMVGSSGSEPAGPLVLSVRQRLQITPPTINQTGTIDRVSGTATISGTIQCAETLQVGLSGELRQRAGRFTVIHGGFFQDLQCSPPSIPWSATVVGENGPFGAGPASVNVSSFGCDEFECVSAETSAKVKLQPSHSK